jgi:DNA (cytosine-5)-methyltransferase 1
MVDPSRLPRRHSGPGQARAALLDAYGRGHPDPHAPDAYGRRRKAVVIGFAGGGGSSIAVAQALGFHPDAALNHWPLALKVHERNFPGAAHHCADITETDCRHVVPGRDIGLFWISPDCRHFSKAKGAAPVSARVRGLAWVAIPWAKVRKPDVIILENVEEFLTWCPLIRDAQGRLIPDPARKGETFRRWVRRLEQCGYVVEWRILNAADYGAPTSRKRLFLIARRDGKPIVWPAPTHAPRKVAVERGLPAYRSAASVIDFSRRCPSIFLTKEEAKAAGVKRPLQPATLARIAKGLFRYTIANADPFIVPITHRGSDRVHSSRDPLATITTAHRGELAVCAPHLTKFRHGSAGADLRDGTPTITSNGTGARQGCGIPMGLVEAELEAAYVEQANSNRYGHPCSEPVSTVMQSGVHQRLLSATLVKHNHGSHPFQDVEGPLHALTAQIDSYYGMGFGNDARDPMRTCTGKDRHSVIVAELTQAAPGDGRRAQVLAFLQERFGAPTAEDIADPLRDEHSRAKFGLVLIAGAVWMIRDIGMRMLDPETELATAMGVPGDYILGSILDDGGKPIRITKTNITRMVGNMVSPPPARALIAANCDHLFHEPEALAA